MKVGTYITNAWWVATFAGLAIVITVTIILFARRWAKPHSTLSILIKG